MQTAVEYLQEHFKTLIQEDKKGLYRLLFEQAKEMEYNQMKGMYVEGAFAKMRHFDGKEFLTADEYISETYGSKGSDEIKTDNI